MILGGNSMGGWVALAAASLAPNRMTQLIIMSAAAVEVTGVPLGDPLALAPDAFVSGMVHNAERFRRTTPYRTLEDARELNAGRQTYARYQGTTALSARAHLDLKSITMPTLLLWGRHDAIIPLAYGQALAAKLAQAQLVVLEEVGHLPHMEAPEETNRAIDRFLEENPGSDADGRKS
jgi:4,5:9,10-diseco-3-hydroxy-5,9,17-trioxoandrosta-1(10),2-diene-4-oate hydrolase